MHHFKHKFGSSQSHETSYFSHIHSVSGERQQTLYFFAEVFTYTMFSRKKRHLTNIWKPLFLRYKHLKHHRALWLIFIFYCFKCFKLWEIFGKNKDNKIFTITLHKALHNNVLQYTRDNIGMCVILSEEINCTIFIDLHFKTKLFS